MRLLWYFPVFSALLSSNFSVFWPVIWLLLEFLFIFLGSRVVLGILMHWTTNHYHDEKFCFSTKGLGVHLWRFTIYWTQNAHLSYRNGNLTKKGTKNAIFYCNRALLSATFSTFLIVFVTLLTDNKFVLYYFSLENGENAEKYQKSLKYLLIIGQ